MLGLYQSRKVWIGATIALIITVVGPVHVQAQNIPFIPPPRTIANITAILDGEKPDEAQIAARKANADATQPNNLSAADLAQFYYDRGNARALLARNKEALADGLRALAAAKGTPDYRQSRRIEQFIALQYRALGDLKSAKAMLETEIREDEEAGAGYGITGAYRTWRKSSSRWANSAKLKRTRDASKRACTWRMLVPMKWITRTTASPLKRSELSHVRSFLRRVPSIPTLRQPIGALRRSAARY